MKQEQNSRQPKFKNKMKSISERRLQSEGDIIPDYGETGEPLILRGGGGGLGRSLGVSSFWLPLTTWKSVHPPSPQFPLLKIGGNGSQT